MSDGLRFTHGVRQYVYMLQTIYYISLIFIIFCMQCIITEA